MSYYDHASHLALGLGQWDMKGQNGSGAYAGIDEVKLRPVTPPRERVAFGARLRFWRKRLARPVA